MSGSVFLPGLNQFTSSLQLSGLQALGMRVAADVVDLNPFVAIQTREDFAVAVDVCGGANVRGVGKFGGQGIGDMRFASRSDRPGKTGRYSAREHSMRDYRQGTIVRLSENRNAVCMVYSTNPFTVIPLTHVGQPKKVGQWEVTELRPEDILYKRAENQRLPDVQVRTGQGTKKSIPAKMERDDTVVPVFPTHGQTSIREVPLHGFVYQGEQLIGYLFQGKYYPAEKIRVVDYEAIIKSGGMLPERLYVVQKEHEPLLIVGVETGIYLPEGSTLYGNVDVFISRLANNEVIVDGKVYSIQYNHTLYAKEPAKKQTPAVRQVIPFQRPAEPVRSETLLKQLFPGLPNNFTGDTLPQGQVYVYPPIGVRRLVATPVSSLGILSINGRTKQRSAIYDNKGAVLGYLIPDIGRNRSESMQGIFYKKEHVAIMSARVRGVQKNILTVWYGEELYPVAIVNERGDLEALPAFVRGQQVLTAISYPEKNMRFNFDAILGSLKLVR